MNYEMNLWSDSFESVKSGFKTIEMRLYDEKRSLIKIDDIINFVNINTNEIVKCRVQNIYLYKTFNELYLNHNKMAIGYTEDKVADSKDMLLYYSQDKIDKYGVIGIEIKVIND
ncbi:MAG: ASCH domain-containing protein [Romboutsia sp.]|uniref:ASCH domain-containing protein n=1 Tax=Romboutsia sp. TaxID=1965302 RepID=UPI003F3A12F6